MDRVYLDYNATAPVRPAVVEAMAQALRSGGNPSSVHRPGRSARAAVEQARRGIAELIGVSPETVVFTGGGTEANNLALAQARGGRVLALAVEHDSVLQAAAAGGRRLDLIPVDGDGVVDLGALERMLAAEETPALVSVMLANNETGVIQPVGEAARLARARGALVHCDAVQALGKQPLDVEALGADYVSLSAHKLGGPPGVGALVVNADAPFRASIVGGGQEMGRRAGTENVVGIVGFAVAAAEAVGALDDFARLRDLHRRLERRLKAAAPSAVIAGEAAPRLANTTAVALPGVESALQVMSFDLEGVAISAGAACSSGKIRPSHVLSAMGMDEAVAGAVIRISSGWASTAEDFDRALAVWSALCQRHGAGSPTDPVAV